MRPASSATSAASTEPRRGTFVRQSSSKPKAAQCSHIARVVDPNAMQDVLVGGCVSAAVGSALFNGLKKDEVELCDLCSGNGGSRCFVCEGSGKKSEVTREMLAESKTPMFGNPRECKPCLGSGLIPCSKCKGKGFLNGL